MKTSDSLACATNQKGLWCWGSVPDETGDVPYELGGAQPSLKLEGPIDDFAVGDFHLCAIKNGEAFCWGGNARGALGDGTLQARERPTKVTAVSDRLRAIAIRNDVTCAVTTAGKVKCWGGPRNLEPGVNEVRGQDEIIQISASQMRLCFLSKAGAVHCWGMDANGNSGNVGPIDFPFDPPRLLDLSAGVTRIAVGSQHVCGIISKNQVRCVGDNRLGQSGGSALLVQRATPVTFGRP